MGRWSELCAGLICATLFLLWRFGYPHTSAAALVPVIALLLVGAGIYLRRVRLTLAMREGIFLPGSRYKRWFSGRMSGLILAVVEGTAIVLGMCHFALHARLPEVLLAAAIGICTLAVIAWLRRVMARELRPEFAVAAKVVASTAVKAAAKSIGKAAGIGGSAAAGATVGSFLGPVGTAAGGIGGAIVGWLVVDYAVVSLDEYFNRDEFEAELRDAINVEQQQLRARILQAYASQSLP